MTVYNFILAFLSAGLMFYGLYFLIEAILIHKKIFDKHSYFVIACFTGSFFGFFELLLSLPLSQNQYLLFHKLKWFAAILATPFQTLTFLECFFPKSKKIGPLLMLLISPFFLISMFGDAFLSLPIKTIIIHTKFSDFIYNLGTPQFMYIIYGILLYSNMIYYAIYSLISRNTYRKLPLVIYFLAAILSTANDMFVYRGLYSNIFLIEYFFPASFTFIFLDFILENRKTHLSVVELKNEAVHRLKIMEIYTRKSLVESIEKGEDPTKFQPNNIQIATLFTDIRDFTGISEGLKPLEVVDLLNSYFNRMNSTIIKYNGEIDKLMGDCIMALFKNPDDALKAAIEMRYELARFNESKTYNVLQTLDVSIGRGINNGIGLNYGEVIIGNIGSESKMDYTVVGDIVNTASRLEALTKYYKVPLIISEDSELLTQVRKIK